MMNLPAVVLRRGRRVLLWVICVLFAVGGCAERIVVYGKKYQHLISAQTTMEKAHRELGKPIWSRRYDPPVAIAETPEYRQLESPVIWYGRPTDVAAYCEAFGGKGPFENVARAEDYAHFTEASLIFFDLLFLPEIIKKRLELNRDEWVLVFWYDADRKFVAYYAVQGRGVAQKTRTQP